MVEFVRSQHTEATHDEVIHWHTNLFASSNFVLLINGLAQMRYQGPIGSGGFTIKLLSKSAREVRVNNNAQ
jgi:hypothetical protein